MEAQASTNRNMVIRMLVIGFSLVFLVLGIAAFVAVRDSALRADASQLVRDHLIHARLLHEVQAQEDILAYALHRIEATTDAEQKKQHAADLASANQAIQDLAREAQQTPHAEEWQLLALASQRFTELANTTLLEQENISPSLMDQLFSEHDQFVKFIHDLIQRNTEQWISADEKMDLQLSDLGSESMAMLVVCFLLAILFSSVTVMIVRKNIQRIEWQRDELNRVSWHMLQTQEETARRFSHELHDELGQSLAAVRSNLTNPADLDQVHRADCLQLVDEAIANVRELSQLLRPVILDDFGLEAGLRWLAERFSQRSRIEVSVSSDLKQRPAPEIETHFFRIAQEALTNIARHSQATAVRISLKETKKQLTFVIEDNGVGISPNRPENQTSLGLVGMRARARECGGLLYLTKTQPQGLTITVIIPNADIRAK
jgi:signal transduction histidine kinase